MSLFAMLHCDGAWDRGLPCRAFLTLPRELANWPDTARCEAAVAAGYVVTEDGRDLCPSCARREVIRAA